MGSRCVHHVGCTASPTGVVQQGRQLAWLLQDGKIRARLLLRDRDCKFTAGFDQIFRSEGVEVVRLPYRTPVANAACERVLGSLRRECLDWLIILGERHLVQVLREYFDHYNRPGRIAPWASARPSPHRSWRVA